MVGEQPVWLRAVTRPGAAVFGLMFALESLARAVLAALIPLQAYAILKEARDVSLTYFGVAIFGFFISFTIPFFIRRFRRRWVYTAGVVMLILSAISLTTFTYPGQIAAMVLRSVAAASLNITLSLYVLDYIRKRDLVRSEPLKLLMLGMELAQVGVGGFRDADTLHHRPRLVEARLMIKQFAH